jgi:hypothetical protein
VNRNLLLHQRLLQDHASEFKTRKAKLTAGRTPAYQQAEAAERATAKRLDQTQERVRALDSGDVEAQANREVQAATEELVRNIASSEEAAKRIRENEEQGVEETKGMHEEEEEEEYVETPLVAPVAPELQDEEWEKQVAEAWGAGGRMVPPVNRLWEVRNQRFAVVSVLEDYEEGDEPGLCIWAAFDTEEEALKYNKCVAAKHVRDHDLAIVSMYEWAYPHLMASDTVEQLYRNEELNNIMKHARTAGKRVRDFERQCEEEGVEVPTIEVEGDLNAPAPLHNIPVAFDVDDPLAPSTGEIPDVDVPSDVREADIEQGGDEASFDPDSDEEDENARVVTIDSALIQSQPGEEK